MTDMLLTVPIDDIRHDPHISNPRDKVIDTTDLQESIKQDGLQNPLWVRLGDDNDFLLISGHRRLAALKRIGSKDVPVLLKDVAPEKIRRLMLIGNLQKAQPQIIIDSNGDVIGGLAMAIREEKIETGCTNIELAAAIGMTPDTIGAYLALHDESVKIKKAVASGALLISVYSRMKRQPQETKEKIVSCDGQITARKVRDLIKQENKDSLPDDIPYHLGEDNPTTPKLNDILVVLKSIDTAINERDLFILTEIQTAVARLQEKGVLYVSPKP